jgi:hypothetical protein
MPGVDLATDGAEAIRADGARMLACGRKQRSSLMAIDALAGRAVEPGGGDDLSRFPSAAAIELRDQAAQRLRAMRENKLVELDACR